MDPKEYSSPGFDWGQYLTDEKSEAAPVNLFPHAQMASHWHEIDNGVKVEVLNLNCPLPYNVYWIAEVVKVAGYKALLRYEGFGEDSEYDFWCHLCTHDVQAVGWCATVGKPLVPPKTIHFKHGNWKTFLVERLTGSKTLPKDFPQRVTESIKTPFKLKMRLEVMDKTQISRKRIGVIEEIMGGRLRIRYEDADDENDQFWCHMGSPLVHHIGWSEKVGHRILVASKNYKTIPGFHNSKPELFNPVRVMKTNSFKVGMKLEAIDPLNLSSICVATVRKVLKHGYLMIGIDGSEAIEGSDWFCYHVTSPSIFPAGFCQSNNISLNYPKDCKHPFSWEDYLLKEGCDVAPPSLFTLEEIDHGFTAGMKLEAVDLMEPRLICVATITRVVGRLLRVHFDGWEEEYDQWLDAHSCNIYPVGWCELVGYELQPPANMKDTNRQPVDGDKLKKKNKTKIQTSGGKKKRKRISHHGKKTGAFPAINKEIEISPSRCTEEREAGEMESVDEDPFPVSSSPDPQPKSLPLVADIELPITPSEKKTKLDVAT